MGGGRRLKGKGKYDLKYYNRVKAELCLITIHSLKGHRCPECFRGTIRVYSGAVWDRFSKINAILRKTNRKTRRRCPAAKRCPQPRWRHPAAGQCPQTRWRQRRNGFRPCLPHTGFPRLLHAQAHCGQLCGARPCVTRQWMEQGSGSGVGEGRREGPVCLEGW